MINNRALHEYKTNKQRVNYKLLAEVYPFLYFGDRNFEICNMLARLWFYFLKGRLRVTYTRTNIFRKVTLTTFLNNKHNVWLTYCKF